MLGALAAVLAMATLATTAEARDSTCPPNVTGQRSTTLTSKPTSDPGRFLPVDAKGNPLEANAASMSLAFGSGRESKSRTQTYKLPSGIDADDVRVAPINDFVDTKSKDVLPVNGMQLTYSVTTNRVDDTLIDLRVCYDPGGPTEISPGSYDGALLMGADGAQVSPLALNVTASDDDLWVPVLVLILSVAVGVAIRRFGDANRNTDWTKVDYVVTAGAGLAAAVGIYLKSVTGDPVFEGDIASLWPLAVAGFGATIAGKTLKDLFPSSTTSG